MKLLPATPTPRIEDESAASDMKADQAAFSAHPGTSDDAADLYHPQIITAAIPASSGVAFAPSVQRVREETQSLEAQSLFPQ